MNVGNLNEIQKYFFILFLAISTVSQARMYVYKPIKDLKIVFISQDTGIGRLDKISSGVDLEISPGLLKNTKLKLFKIEIINKTHDSYQFENNNDYLKKVNEHSFLSKLFSTPLVLQDLFLISTMAGIGGLAYYGFWHSFKYDRWVAYFILGYCGSIFTMVFYIIDKALKATLPKFIENNLLNQNTSINAHKKIVKYFFISEDEAKNKQKFIFKNVKTDEMVEISCSLD